MSTGELDAATAAALGQDLDAVEAALVDEAQPVKHIDLEVRWRDELHAWVVEPYAAEDEVDEHGAIVEPYAIKPTKAEAVDAGEILGRAFAAEVNDDRKCELYIRKRNGQLGDRRTYPRSADPVESVG